MDAGGEGEGGKDVGFVFGKDTQAVLHICDGSILGGEFEKEFGVAIFGCGQGPIEVCEAGVARRSESMGQQIKAFVGSRFDKGSDKE